MVSLETACGRRSALPVPNLVAPHARGAARCIPPAARGPSSSFKSNEIPPLVRFEKILARWAQAMRCRLLRGGAELAEEALDLLAQRGRLAGQRVGRAEH